MLTQNPQVGRKKVDVSSLAQLGGVGEKKTKMAYALIEGVLPTAEKKEERKEEQRASRYLARRGSAKRRALQETQRLVASNWPNRQDHVKL